MGHFLGIKHRIPVEADQFSLFEEEIFITHLVPRPFCQLYELA
jgi:hypothetical protein